MPIDRKKIESLIKDVEELPEFTIGGIEAAAQELESYNYAPTLLLPAGDFLRFTKEDLIEELRRLADMGPDDVEEVLITGRDVERGEGDHPLEMSDEELDDILEKHAGLLVHHYRLLVRLRANEPEAWDEVTELYDED